MSTSDKKEEKSEKEKTKKTIEEFGATVSVHGIGAAIAAEGPKRAFWILVFIGALVGCIVCVVYSVQELNQHATKTSITMTYSELDFPAVTICNLNPYMRSALAKDPRVGTMMAAYDKRSKELP